MVLFNLKVLAKFGLCSNCSQKLGECSLARARILVNGKNGKHWGNMHRRAMNVSGSKPASFCRRA